MVGTLGPGIGFGRAARFRYVATAGQTTFSGADASAQALTLVYTPGFLEVAVDGIWLTPDEYTATNGSSIVFATGLAVGRVVYAYAITALTVANTYDKTQNGADILVPTTFRSYLPTPGALFGLTLSTAGASTTLTVAAGFAADSTNTRLMNLASAMAKTTSAWAAGTAVGGLDTGTIANSTWYHFFQIMNPATGAVDIVFSATAAPASGPTTLPSGFTLFRRIGSAKTNGSGQWTSFTQIGDEFLWLTTVSDATTVACSSTAANVTVTVPTGLNMEVLFYGLLSSSGATYVNYYAPDRGTQTAGTNNASLAAAATGIQVGGYFRLRTNTSAQIGVVSLNANGSYYIGTAGWIDTRGKL